MSKKLKQTKETKMKIKLVEVNNAQQFFQQLTGLSKAPSAAYKIMRWIQSEIEPALKLVDEQKNELVKKHGEEKDGGVSISPENEEAMQAFIKEWSEYLNTEVDMQPLNLTMDELVEALSVKDAEGKDINSFTESLLFSLEKFTKGGAKDE